MMLRPMIAQRAFNTPLLMDAGKAAAALSGIGGRIVEGGVRIANVDPVQHNAFENGRPSMARLPNRIGRAFETAGQVPFDVIGSVAVIPIEGTLIHKGTFTGQDDSGQTSYEGLQAQVRFAAGTDQIKGVVFEVDSYGGEAAGLFETARMVRELSAAKPTIAILTDNALSGGYALASQARQIVAPEFGRAGSIGVIVMHVDFSGALEQEGITVTLLTAGERKADGNPFEALPDRVADRIRSEIETMRQRFAETVELGRGARFTASAALATEADMFRSPEAAELGMIDAVGDPNDAFEEFVSTINGSGA